MSNEYARFGRADKFEIALRWVEDAAPPPQRPAGHGWSMGHVELFIAGVNLTASRVGPDQQSHVGWYLAPMLHWIATNWVELLHEEDFAWPAKDAAVAVNACQRALDFWGAVEDDAGRRTYRQIHAWYRRHGLRSAAAGGLFPDLFIRRLADDIELSWSGHPPQFAPEDMAFESGAGFARLAVEDVAEPLWQALLWAKHNPPPELHAPLSGDWEALCRKIDKIESLEAITFERAAVANDLLERVRASFAKEGAKKLLDERLEPGKPYLTEFSPAIAMFGGANPNLSDDDIDALRDALLAMKGGQDSPALAKLVEGRNDLPVGNVPYEDGYQFAEDFLEDIEPQFGEDSDEFVDPYVICKELSITIEEQRLDTNSIRGVALAGKDFAPLILINTTSVFNRNNEGKRFTLAHELCHIIFDRTRARRIAHISGSWVAPGIEKRANAFAAYLLMPRPLLAKYLASAGEPDIDIVRKLAEQLRVNLSSLVEHLYNLDFIDEVERETLRSEIRH